MGLFESLKIGYSTLQWSADIITDDQQAKQAGKLTDILLTVFSVFFENFLGDAVKCQNECVQLRLDQDS